MSATHADHTETIANYLADHRVSTEELKKLPAICFIVALKKAKDEMSYSNLTCRHLDAVQEILVRYCEEHKIPIDGILAEPELFAQWAPENWKPD